jgi:hypothetical protein
MPSQTGRRLQTTGTEESQKQYNTSTDQSYISLSFIADLCFDADAHRYQPMGRRSYVNNPWDPTDDMWGRRERQKNQRSNSNIVFAYFGQQNHAVAWKTN